MKKVKMIWDFRGPAAMQTAKHHEIHLIKYLQQKTIEHHLLKIHELSEFKTEVWLVTDESFVNIIRQDLKPHRGQLFNSEL
ncbi:hypothetical protein [Spongiivirga citrea]|uniref:Uncharacterized protein n=1 Tax=Spongiivirga citrea TaxID=1481457 RepID=A0A6M0CFV8_9FLAO|nr:hypothetical protein [Spongiivirga citrea]NER16332.1 hypothetical protein [Spongiivirga citrea]